MERAVAKKVVHPKYNFFTYEFDLALVKLDAPLEFAPHIAPICLPATNELLIGQNATGNVNQKWFWFSSKVIYLNFCFFFFI